jgi:drug/metabolite transporter (DMT)-like permease
MIDQRVRGIALGLAAVLSWAIYNIGASVGRAEGFTSADLTLLRYVGGGLALIALILLRGAKPAGFTISRVFLLTLFAGPPFALAITTGFALAPLSHAVVVSPGVAMIVAALLGIILNDDSISPQRILGMVVLIIGLVLIATKSGIQEGFAASWSGDLCFVMSGSLWGLFTFVLGRWKLDAVTATAAIAVSSSFFFIPYYFIFAEPAVEPATQWVVQLVLQGVLGGGLAVVFYVAAIQALGASSAGLFPALVPVASVVLAMPLRGHLISLQEALGVACAFAGMVFALMVLPSSGFNNVNRN